MRVTTSSQTDSKVHDFGTSGVMRLTYFGQQHLAGVQRWHIRRVSENHSWVVAKTIKMAIGSTRKTKRLR